jgi:MFS family permease
VAGQVTAAFGWRAAFGVAAGSAIAGLAVALLTGSDPVDMSREPAGAVERTRWKPLLAPGLVSIYLLHFTALFLWAGVRTAMWPSLASEAGLSVRAIGVALGAGSFVTLATLASAGRLGDRWGKVPVLSLGLAISVVGLAVPVLAAGALALLVSLVLLDVGQGLLAPTASALLADVYRQPGIGLATGLMRLLGDTGWLVGPLLVTGAIQWRDSSLALGLAALVPLGNLILLRAAGPSSQVGGRPGFAAASAGPRGT